ncbi:Uncharacterized protein conserved in bacteria [Escherichia coli]|uniref:Uncharacterized protein conserved in bacteria n=1 Tax=Escherichia coli TaxID=562 RepID=A0A377KAD6_ECOLX|nr:Uncharacterized protein conserved in bacteria [Escherichia coli]
MDKQSLHETAKRVALELPFVELCWPFGPEFDVFKIGGKIFMLSSELRGVPFINLKSDPQKSLLNQQIYPSIKPGYHMNKKALDFGVSRRGNLRSVTSRSDQRFVESGG